MHGSKNTGRTVKQGGFEVRINTAKSGCRVVYYRAGKRVFERCKSEEDAEERAREILAQWNRGVSPALQQNPEELLRYERSRNLLSPFSIHIDEAVSEYANAKQVLGQVPLLEVARFYREFFPEKNEARQVSEVIEEYLEVKMEGCSEVYIKDMRNRLSRFADTLHCSLNQLTPKKVELFFDQLRGKSPRSFNNFRRVVCTFLNYCRRREYLPWEVDLLRKIETRKEQASEVAIFSPEEFSLMLEKAPEKLLPVLVLGGLCGLRTAEIQRLDWGAINWQERYVGIRGRIAKTGDNRLAPLSVNALEWLRPYMQRTGRVWPEAASVLNRAYKELAEVCQIEGGWRRNALRHSFCSYRLALTQNIQQASIEAGNSPNVLKRNYLSVVSKSKAEAWFGIVPEDVGKCADEKG